jgi:hypothetical protein
MGVVPYSRGGANEALRDLLGGRVHAVIDGLPALKGALQSGELKALAIMSRGPSPASEYPNGVSALFQVLRPWAGRRSLRGGTARILEVPKKKAPPKRGLEVDGPRLAIAGPRLKACRTRPRMNKQKFES